MSILASLGAASLVALGAAAQTTAPAAAITPTPAATDVAPVKLSYGVGDVVKLSRAQVSEDVTLSFIRNSGKVYNLAPKDVVYLRDQGVSDRVINAMLDQGKSVPAITGTQAVPANPPVAPQALVYQDANAAAAAQTAPQYAPTYDQSAPVYVQPDTSYVPPSTIYVIPYSSPGYGYSSYYPYYDGYYPYYGSSISLGFGFGGRGYRGGYYGGHYGGYHGGGYHGGGFGGGAHGSGGHGGRR